MEGNGVALLPKDSGALLSNYPKISLINTIVAQEAIPPKLWGTH